MMLVFTQLSKWLPVAIATQTINAARQYLRSKQPTGSAALNRWNYVQWLPSFFFRKDGKISYRD
jgi:hypothetical protein